MRNKIIGFVIMMVLVGGAIWGGLQVNSTPNKESKLALSIKCTRANGTWLADYWECEGDVKDLCQQESGKFFDCESVCRHDGVSKVCTRQCVKVCKF